MLVSLCVCVCVCVWWIVVFVQCAAHNIQKMLLHGPTALSCRTGPLHYSLLLLVRAIKNQFAWFCFAAGVSEHEEAKVYLMKLSMVRCILNYCISFLK